MLNPPHRKISKSSSWLISSGGRRGSLIKLFRAVGEESGSKVVVTDASEFSAAGHLADAFELVPPVLSEDFVTETLRICIKHGCTTVVPTIDPEIAVFSEARPRFLEHGIDVWVSTPEVARLGWDKWKFHQFLLDAGLPTIDTIEVSDARKDSFPGKVVAKPRTGSSSIGVIIAENADSLDLNGLSDDYIVQRFAEGIEVTVDVAVSARGAVLATIPRRRLEVRAGEVSKGVTVHVSEIEKLVRDLFNKLPGAYGVLNVQLIFNPITKSIVLLEINPRFGGGYPLSHAAGGDLISAMVESSETPDLAVSWTPGAVMLRYDEAIFYIDDRFREQPWS